MVDYIGSLGGVSNFKFSCLLAAITVLVYSNANFCDFVFDDVSAIKDNKDLRPSTPIHHLLFHDFWGTPMSKEHSHKSYRPFSVLTFRLNFLLHGLQPFGYHFVNIVLHVLVCLILLKWIQTIHGSTLLARVATLLFAIHPIHTEAVTGVVGRAELLSSIFFLLSLIVYKKVVNSTSMSSRLGLYGVLFTFVGLAMLSKEQGITVLGLCFVYDLVYVQNVDNVVRTKLVLESPNNNKMKPLEFQWKSFLERTLALFVVGLTLILLRLKVVMGLTLPVFTNFDNPAAHESAPVKQLTWSYLIAKNFWLLVTPSDLCCDWTMGSIPLVSTLGDQRNLGTILFAVCYSNVIIASVLHRHGKIVLFSIALLTIPFLPASNLFFPVGFVIAERVLYLPSMGFSLIVAAGIERLYKRRIFSHSIFPCLIGLLIIVHSSKTFSRNFDWRDETSIFLSGIRVNQRNAKLWNNIGHALESQGRHEDALKYFTVATKVQPDDVGAFINVGRTLNALGHTTQAEKMYRIAKSLLPQPKKGQKYTARIAPQHLNVFLNLANLIAKDTTRLEEADQLYRQAISMRSDYIQAYINRGDVLIKMKRLEEAKAVYQTALKYDFTNADIYYNIGVVNIELGLNDDALDEFIKALQVDPNHVQSLLNSAILMQSSGKPELRPLAYDRLHKVLQIAPKEHSDRVYFNLGMLAMDDEDSVNAEIWFKQAVQAKQGFRSALFNLALLLNEQKRSLEAVPYLIDLLKYFPDHVKGLILLGEIYTNHVKDLDAAERCYRKIISVDPEHVQGHHNLCVVLVEQGRLTDARECLLKVQTMAPNEDYVRKHLSVVENKIKNTKPAPG